MIALQDEREAFQALERVEQISGCLEESEEEAELVGLVTALEDWLRQNPVTEEIRRA